MTAGASNGYRSFAQVRRHPVWRASSALKPLAVPALRLGLGATLGATWMNDLPFPRTAADDRQEHVQGHGPI
jgi:hypothetical protein